MAIAVPQQRSTDLVDPHVTARLGPYLRALWARRSYMWFVARSELRAQQMNTVLGNAWHLLNPALSIAVYWLIFGVVLDVTRGVDNMILFLTAGVFTYSYTQRATTVGSKSLIANAGLIRSIRFPRAMLPMTAVLTAALAQTMSIVVMFGVALIGGEPPSLRWALVPFVFLAQTLLNLGLAFFAARLTVHVRDTTQLLPFLFRLAFYGSGVLFNVDAYATGSYRWLFTLNPLYGYITLVRWCVLGYPISGATIVATATLTIVILLTGFLWFRAAEERYARD